MYLGSKLIDDLLTFTCSTHDPTTQAAADADADPSYRVYENETGTPLLTGTMAKLDDANTLGFYSEEITLSAANGFELGKSYTVRIEATVDGITGVTERTFQMQPDSPGVTTLLARLTSTRAGYLDNLSAGAVALESSLQGLITTIGAAAAGVATAVWGAVTRTLTAGTNIVLAKDTGITGFNDLSAAQVNAEVDAAISDAGLATASALATVDSVVDAIQAKTDNLPDDPADQSLIIAATDALATAIGTRASQTSVDDLPTNAELSTALSAADDAVLAAIAALNNLSSAQAQAAAAAALAAYDGPTTAEMEARTLAAADYATATALAAVDTVVDSILALLDDPRSEPSQGAPPASADLATKLDWLYTAWRNKKSNDGTETSLFADNGSTVIAKQATSEAAGTVTKAEWITGA